MAITTVNKAKIGVEDLYIDDTGTHQSASRKTSRALTVPIRKLNASHIPVTTTVRTSPYAAGGANTPAALNDLDVDAVLDQILDDLEDLGQPDGSTLTVASGVLKVADGGIAETQLKQTGGSEAVTNATMRADAVAGSASVVSSPSGQNVIEAGSIGNADIGDDEINSEHYAAGSIDHEHLADNIVDIDNLNMDGSGGTFSHFIVAAQVQYSIQSGDISTTTATITVTGATASDAVIATIDDTNANGISLEQAYVHAADTVKLIGTGNWTANDKVNILIIRAAASI